MHWNLQLEAQACDLIYLLDQKHKVKIHKFSCEDTVESRIQDLQVKKFFWLVLIVLMLTNLHLMIWKCCLVLSQNKIYFEFDKNPHQALNLQNSFEKSKFIQPLASISGKRAKSLSSFTSGPWASAIYSKTFFLVNGQSSFSGQLLSYLAVLG